MATHTRPQSTSLQRDASAKSHTRNKENVPSPSPNKATLSTRGRSLIPSLVQSSDKSDFFTDSFLEDENASSESLIPSPFPQSKSLSKPRRKLNTGKPSRDQDSGTKHRSSRSETLLDLPRNQPPSFVKPLARGPSPIRSIGLSTPPRSRDGSLNESPTSAQFSSPPRALTETYERIDQEEDLAATEGEISDPESDRARGDYVEKISKSPGLTPTGPRHPARPSHTRDEDLTAASVLSDPTGMSFLNQLSDPNLAHAMTPHLLQSAADREALRKTWESKKPIAFGKAHQVHLHVDDIVDFIESPPYNPPQRLVAFSKAGKRKLASDFARLSNHQRSFSDVTDRLDHNTQDLDARIHKDNWHPDNVRREGLPHNPRLHRVPYFPRNHGFPERHQFEEGGTTNDMNRRFKSESPVAAPTPRVQPELQMRKSTGGLALNSLRDTNVNQSEPDLSLAGKILNRTASEVDWAQAAARRPDLYKGNDSPQRSESRLSLTADYETSPEKSRRFDLDFTGRSFQVSESPPLRTKNLASDSVRDREIRGLEKRAVTTNRLTQLRAQESLEKLRQRSMSPVSENGDLQGNTDLIDVEPRTNGERLPDTPVVIYRSSSFGSGKKSSSETPPVRPSPARSESYDLLQRLAKSSSSTSRSSTPSNKPLQDVMGNEKQGDEVANKSAQNATRDRVQELAKSSTDTVQATPRVTGARTDTILPDTIKTIKQNPQRFVHLQTPHVSAGGWIETPAPINQQPRLDPVLESNQELIAELTHGIAKDNKDESNQTIIAGEVAKPVASVPIQNPPTVGNKILSNVKDNIDDSLMLGNDTIQSLQNVLDMDQTDMTILSHISESMRAELAGQTDTEFLGRIGSRLDRVRKQIHDAREGISKLESQMLQPEQSIASPKPLKTTNPCEVCGQPNSPEMQHAHPPKSATNFPFTLLSITLPIPILFRLRPATSAQKWRLPQLTLAGWLVLTIWTWYILECTLAELYSHPTYASHYIWPTEREPDFPFVLPTMLWRWSRLNWVYPSLISPLIRTVSGIFRVLGMWLGLIDGYVDGPRDAVVERVMETVYQSVETGLAGMGHGMDMMNDEFL